MGDTWWWLIDVIAPVILVILLVWLAFRSWGRAGRREEERTEQATRDVYREEESRLREGTDDL